MKPEDISFDVSCDPIAIPLPPVRVPPIVGLDEIMDRLERVAEQLSKAWSIPAIDESQRIVMGILVEHGRFEVAPNGMWRKPNTQNSGTVAAGGSDGKG